MRLNAALVAIVATLATGGAAHGQTYPNKSVRIIIPGAPGDSCDVLSRLVAPKMSERLGQALVIENRAGSPRRQRHGANHRARGSMMCNPAPTPAIAQALIPS